MITEFHVTNFDNIKEQMTEVGKVGKVDSGEGAKRQDILI